MDLSHNCSLHGGMSEVCENIPISHPKVIPGLIGCEERLKHFKGNLSITDLARISKVLSFFMQILILTVSLFLNFSKLQYLQYKLVQIYFNQQNSTKTSK